jgi:hypothetical protein
VGFVSSRLTIPDKRLTAGQGEDTLTGEAKGHLSLAKIESGQTR